MYKRLINSTVIWSWILNGLRLGSGLIVLPLVFRELTEADLGMYYVLLSLAAFAPMVDFGFGPTIDRFIGYAMGGAETLAAHGLPVAGTAPAPNYVLLWELVLTTRKLYRYLTLALFISFGTAGTLTVSHFVHQTTSPFITWLAWATTLVSMLLDIYSNWWGIYLRGLNEVRTATRIGVVASLAKLITAAGLLLAGAGLLSLPIAGMLSSFIQRHFARVRCLQLLPPQPQLDYFNLKKNLAILWPNSWRLGLQMAISSLTFQANTLICASLYELSEAAKYGASVQLIGIASSMASVWTFIKWPLISQLQARRDFVMIQRVLWPRIWLQILTFLFLAGTVILIAPTFLHWIGKNKQLLPTLWLVGLALASFMELQLSTFGTLIASGNRLPYLWPSVAGNVLSLLLSLSLVHFTHLGVGGLVMGPIVSGCLFNYWYWPPYGAREMKTTLFRFLFFGPSKHP